MLKLQPKDLIDLTSMGRILTYMISSSLDVVEVVDENTTLESVAELCLESNSEDEELNKVRQFQTLLKEGKVTVCLPQNIKDFLDRKDNAVYCIYLPPLYLIKDKKVKYE